MLQLTPQDFKDRIITKYPDGISSDGIPYVQMDATEMINRFQKANPTGFADGVTNDGIKYTDFLPKETARKEGALFNVSTPEVQSPGMGLGVAAKGVGNVIPDFLRTLVEFPVGVTKTVVGAVKEATGLAKEQQPENILTPLTKQGAISRGEPTEFGTPSAIANYLSAATDLKPYIDTLKTVIPSAAQKIVKGDFIGAAQDIANHPFQQIAPFLLLLEGGAKAIGKGEPFSTAVSKTLSPVNDTVSALTDLAKTAPGKALQISREASINSLADAYRSTAEETIRTSKTLNRALARGKDPAQFLAERNIVPKIVDGKIQSLADADTLHKSATPLNEHLDMALEQLQPSIPRTPLSDVENLAVKGIRSESNINKNIANRLEADVRQEFSDYRSNFGDYTTLKQINGIKRGKWAITPFDATKPYQGTVNYEIGKAAMKTIENSVPKDAFPVRELNKYIGDIYESEKFLRSLNGKAVVGGRLGKYFAGLAGSIIGSALKIPVIGELGGYLGGRFVMDLLQRSTFSNPLKSMILRNLQVNDPQSYSQVLDFINKAKLEQQMRLRLPAPSYLEGQAYRGGETKIRNEEQAIKAIEEQRGLPLTNPPTIPK